MRLTADLSLESTKSGRERERERERENNLKLLKEKDCRPRILNLDKLLLETEKKINTFPGKQK